jgi:hypothetical protein
MTSEIAEQSFNRLRQFYNDSISESVKLAGSARALSLQLGRGEDYVHHVLKRQSFSALRRLWLELSPREQ